MLYVIDVCCRHVLEMSFCFSFQLQRLLWDSITGSYMTVIGSKGYTDKSLLEQSHPGKQQNSTRWQTSYQP